MHRLLFSQSFVSLIKQLEENWQANSMFLHFGYHRLPSLRMRIPDRDDGTCVAQIGEKLCTHVLGIITERLRDATLPCRFSNSHSILRVSLVNRGRPTKRASNNDGCPTVRLSTSRLRASETSPDLVSKTWGDSPPPSAIVRSFPPSCPMCTVCTVDHDTACLQAPFGEIPRHGYIRDDW